MRCEGHARYMPRPCYCLVFVLLILMPWLTSSLATQQHPLKWSESMGTFANNNNNINNNNNTHDNVYSAVIMTTWSLR